MFRFAIDRGGTFTDVFAIQPDGRTVTMKLLSSDPDNYPDAPFEAIRRILTNNNESDFRNIASIRMGTTVATNALLEHKGEPVAVVLTRGFRDIFQIGYQNRPEIFDLDLTDPFLLYKTVVEIDERVVLWNEDCKITNYLAFEIAVSGDQIAIQKPIDRAEVEKKLRPVYESGIRSLAVAFIHSYLYPDHELVVEEVAREIGFTHITLSSKVMPMIRYVPRGMTTITDAYLTPHIRSYIRSFLNKFPPDFERDRLLFMQSDGGLTSITEFCGSRSILSGPAGGVVGYSVTTVKDIGSEKPIIAFDMGGTSTDVSRFDGRLQHKFESEIAEVIIQSPQLDIQTVAAGGGSRLFFRNGLFVVGPESSGSDPGPVCYRKNGYLSVTDANLCLGRLIPEYFPKIFGTTKEQPLDKEAVMIEFEKLAKIVNDFNENGAPMTMEEVALGFIKVANEAMCRPIRNVTQGKGFDIRNHVLTCFGGAGGQHACALARSLGIAQVFIHRYAGVLSAYGIALADIVFEKTVPCSVIYNGESLDLINSKIQDLVERCQDHLRKKGFDDKHIRFEIYLNLRYDRTDFAIMVTIADKNAKIVQCTEDNFRSAFVEQYERQFGFSVPDRAIFVDDIRVRSIGFIEDTFLPSNHNVKKVTTVPEPIDHTQCFFEHDGEFRNCSTPIYKFDDLQYGHSLIGPAIIIESNCTILVEPRCRANITKHGNILIDVESERRSTLTPELDPVHLSLFSHIFMGIAEQMGSVLRNTAISTNIKERLDFSCAIFSAEGNLVSNAPHIPVHLGSMSKVVQYLYANVPEIRRGDVFLTNHPSEGGTHLPDLTVVTPVYHKISGNKPIFFLASRGHHADIGGLTPGSMPSHSKSLTEEGAMFRSFRLVSGNVFQEDDLERLLMEPAKYPGCSGTRALNDNISDLKAQIAANNKGSKLVNEMIDLYGLEVVLSYMNHIQKNAELEVRDLMRNVAKDRGTNVLSATEMMDDGSMIKLVVTIDPDKGDCRFDFTGTSEQVHGNWNAPESITHSAIIYCLRCMIRHNIPLNHGILAPIDVRFPKHSILSPSLDAAVVGGNVLTSQRVTDVIFRAFETCAASQGCMNNITFGDELLSYYETVAGGAGATANTSGRSGVHTHMTNTRLTDVEILEKRYPVLVKRFTLNPGTGGNGQKRGGDGVLRELQFRKPLTLSVLTERRVFAPYGMKGGEDGKRGKNLMIKQSDGIIVNLGAKNTIQVEAGDVFHLETPGGGGYGSPV